MVKRKNPLIPKHWERRARKLSCDARTLRVVGKKVLEKPNFLTQRMIKTRTERLYKYAEEVLRIKPRTVGKLADKIKERLKRLANEMHGISKKICEEANSKVVWGSNIEEIWIEPRNITKEGAAVLLDRVRDTREKIKQIINEWDEAYRMLELASTILPPKKAKTIDATKKAFFRDLAMGVRDLVVLEDLERILEAYSKKGVTRIKREYGKR